MSNSNISPASGSQGQSWSDFNKAYDAGKVLVDHPMIMNSPGLAYDAINSANPNASATVMTHSAIVGGIQQSAQDYAAENQLPHHWWDGAIHAVAKGAEWMNKPLKEIQRDYKYIHSLYTKHGIVIGTLGAMAVAGGAAFGSLAGPEGTLIGADIAAAGLRTLGKHMGQFKDSIADSENENYKVSFGRDVANGLGQLSHDKSSTDEGWKKFISGGLDTTFDLALDPLMRVGAVSKAVKTGKWVESEQRAIPFAFKSRGVQEFLARNTTKMVSTDQLNMLFDAGKSKAGLETMFNKGAQYHRALNELAGADAGYVTAKYPELRGVAYDIEHATTADQVHNIFIQAQAGGEFEAKLSIGGAAYVPSRTVVRSAISKASDSLRQPFADSVDASAYNTNNAANFFLPRRLTTTPTAADVANGIDPKTRWVHPAAWSLPKALVSGNIQTAKEVFGGAVGKKVRTFSGYVPIAYDYATKAISTSKFNPLSEDSNNVIYRIAKYSYGEKMAREFVTKWANARVIEPVSGELAIDLAERKRIYAGLLHEGFKASGFPNDPDAFARALDQMGAKIFGTAGGEAFGHGASIAGESALGSNVSRVVTSEGSFNAALHTHQTGDWAMIDFRKFKKAARDMSTTGELYGKVDDSMARNWTDTIFKPYALLTAGFGLRIAASELLPTMIRFGTYETAKAKILATAMKQGYKVLQRHDELDHIAAAVSLALSDGTHATALDFVKSKMAEVQGNGIRKRIFNGVERLANEKDFETAVDLVLATDGHMATGATLNGHGYASDLIEQQNHRFHIAGEVMKRDMMHDPEGRFVTYAPGSTHFDAHWVTNMQKASQNISQRSIAQDVLYYLKRGKSEEEAWNIAVVKEQSRIEGKYYDAANNIPGAKLPLDQDTYAAERGKLTRYRAQDSTTFATHRVSDLRNTFTGADGTLHTDLMQKVADKSKPSLADAHAIEVTAKPGAVIGPELVPYKGLNIMGRIAQEGFKRVIDPIVTDLSRQPLFFHHFKDAMGHYEEALASGALTREQAITMSLNRASNAMLPQIHNTALRTQFSVLARNFLPFYFAQEQATKRYIKLGSENPQAFRFFQLVNHALNDPGFVQTDDQGNRFVTIPGVGEMSAGLINFAAGHGAPLVGGLPISVQGNMESLKTVLPEVNMPGVSPFVAIAGNWIASLDPHMSKYVKDVIGQQAFGRSAMDSLIPSSPVRAWLKAMNADERDATFNNAMLTALAAANYHGQLPAPDDSPVVRQEKLDRIKNNARSVLLIKGLLSLASPLSPKVSEEDPGLRNEFYALVKSKGNYPDALVEFLGKHGKGAISYTVARTESTYPGASMPYTDNAINWIQQNDSLISSKFANGAVYLIPQGATSGDAQVIHDEMIKMHLRSRRTSADFLNAIYVSAGNNQYYADKAVHDLKIKNAFGDKATIDIENSNWQAYRDQFIKANPIWAADFLSTDRRNSATQAYNDLTDLFASGKTPAGQQTDLVKNLMNDYQVHLQRRAAVNSSMFSTSTMADEDAQWQTYLDNLAVQQPLLASVINGVFRRLS